MDYGSIGGGATTAVSAAGGVPSQMTMLPAQAVAVQPGYAAAGGNYAYGAPAAYALAPVAAPTTPTSPAQAPYEIISHRVFVGGFAPGTTEAELRAFFEQHGTVREVKVIRNTEGAGKGYGFVTFDNEAEAAAVRALPTEKLEFKGRRLNLGPAMRRLNHDTAGVTTAAPIYSTGPYYYQPTALVPVEGGYALATQAVSYYAPGGYYIVSGSAPGTTYMQQPAVTAASAQPQPAVYQLGSYTYTPGVTPPTQTAMLYQPMLTPATGSTHGKSPVKVQPSMRSSSGTPTRGGAPLSPGGLRRTGAATMQALQAAAGADPQQHQQQQQQMAAGQHVQQEYAQMGYDPSKLSVPQQQYQWIQQPTSLGPYATAGQGCVQQQQQQQQPVSPGYYAAAGAPVNLSGGGKGGEVLTHYSQMFYHQQPNEFYAQEIAQRSQHRMTQQQHTGSAPNLGQPAMRSPVNPSNDARMLSSAMDTLKI